jgi:uroporphyrinogen-III decarboxylase
VWTTKYPVESLDDIEKIRSVRWELPENLAPPDTANLPPDFAERSLLQTHISSPFVCVAGMMPYQYFLELCATDLDLVKELSVQCQERTLSVLDVLLETRKIDYVWLGGCEWVTPPMASPRIYEELVQDFEAKLISRVHDAGALCHLHCHGNVRSTLELVIRRGADFFEPVEPPPDGDITFAEAKKIAAGRITLGGNVEARLFANDSADAVEAATRRAFEGGKDRMVLKTSAEPISEMTPRMLKSYHRMIDVWEALSPL